MKLLIHTIRWILIAIGTIVLLQYITTTLQYQVADLLIVGVSAAMAFVMEMGVRT